MVEIEGHLESMLSPAEYRRFLAWLQDRSDEEIGYAMGYAIGHIKEFGFLPQDLDILLRNMPRLS